MCLESDLKTLQHGGEGGIGLCGNDTDRTRRSPAPDSLGFAREPWIRKPSTLHIVHTLRTFLKTFSSAFGSPLWGSLRQKTFLLRSRLQVFPLPRWRRLGIQNGRRSRNPEPDLRAAHHRKTSESSSQKIPRNKD